MIILSLCRMVLEVAESFYFQCFITLLKEMVKQWFYEVASKCNHGAFLVGFCAINLYLVLRMLKLSKSFLK